MPSFEQDIRQLAGDSLVVLFGRIISIGGGFFIHTLLVRNLDPSTFGVLSLALTVVSLGVGFATFGMGQAVARFIGGSKRTEASAYVVVAILVVLCTSILLGVGVFSLRDIIGHVFRSTELAEILSILAVLLVLRPVAKVVLGIVQGFEKSKWKVVSNDILPIIVGLPVLLIGILGGEPLLGGIAFYIVQPVIRICALSFNLRRWAEWNLHTVLPERERFTEVLWFAWPLAFESLVVLFLGSIDILMLGWFLPADRVGTYRSVQPVALTLIFLLQALTFIYLPKATQYYERGELANLDSFYKTATRWISLATYPLLVFYVFFGNDFIRVVFTEEYATAWSVLILLSVAMYSRVFAGPNGMTIKAINRTREDLIASISALSTNIVLNYILIQEYGINGAAVATMIGYFVYNVIDLLIIYWYTGIQPFHWKQLRPLIPTTAAVFVLSQIEIFRGRSLVLLILLGVGITLIHVVSIVVSSGLTKDDKELIKQVGQKYIGEP